MKCPVCENEGEEYAIILQGTGTIYYNLWRHKGETVESELDEYSLECVVLYECSVCNFTGPEGMFEKEINFPEVKEDEQGLYIDGFEVRVGPCTIRGKLYIPETIVNLCHRVLQIHKATCMGELPELLVLENERVRQLASRRYRELVQEELRNV